ncbi:MAG: hypothetical protein ACI9HJ_001376, partial [Ulvibacter sp.]
SSNSVLNKSIGCLLFSYKDYKVGNYFELLLGQVLKTDRLF